VEKIDFIKLNIHVTASFLIHFYVLIAYELTRIEKIDRNKIYLIHQTFFLQNLKALPTIFIKNNGTIYNIPVKISQVGIQTLEKPARPSYSTEIFHLISNFVKFSERDLIQLINDSNFVAYI